MWVKVDEEADMRKDFWKLLAWVLGFTALFALILWSVALLTNAEFMDTARSIHAIGILIAICVGGVFAYQRLQLFRTFQPHLTISHNIRHRFIGDSYIHIDVTATLYNSSKVQVEVREGLFSLMKISPVSDDQVDVLFEQVFVDARYQDIQWEVLISAPQRWDEGFLNIEPSETHREICEFIVADDVKSVMIYTFFSNPYSSTPEGWHTTTVYDIPDSESG